MSGIGIIANPHSKLNKRNPTIIRQLESICIGRAKFTKTNNIIELERCLADYSASSVHTLGICGGDGTISQTLNVLLKVFPHDKYPQILLLRGGTMNLIANELHLRGRPPSILTRFFSAATKGNYRTQKLVSLQVNDRIGFIYADGSHLAILEQFYLKKSSSLGAFWLGIKIMCSYLIRGKLYDKIINTMPFSIPAHPEAPQVSLGNIAGTISHLPLGLPLLPLVGKFPGCFQFNLITCSKKKLLWFLPFLMIKHKKGNSLGKFTFCEKKLHIDFGGSIKFTLDGEVHTSPEGEMRFSTGPSFTFIKP